MNKFLAIAALTLLSVSLYHLESQQNVDLTARFENFTTKFNKQYTPTEKTFRQQVYEANMRLVEQHNADLTQTYQLGETQFSDLTQEEFEGIYLTYRPRSDRLPEFRPENVSDDPVVDWTGLTDVKNQGQCGSCWAFSAIGAIEAVLRAKGKGTQNLSEQQLVDCDTQSYGCNGGWEDLAISWSAKYGNNLASEYPYVARDQSCQLKTGQRLISSAKAIPADSLQAAIANYPVSVAVDASNWSQYRGGIFNNCNKSLNHAVLAIGYYADGTWLIKNSWGSWGENGNIRLAAGDTCGVTQDAVIAVI